MCESGECTGGGGGLSGIVSKPFDGVLLGWEGNLMNKSVIINVCVCVCVCFTKMWYDMMWNAIVFKSHYWIYSIACINNNNNKYYYYYYYYYNHQQLQ